MVLATFEAVFSLIIIGLIGFIIIAKQVIPKNIMPVLSPLVLDIGLPCLIFANIIQKFDPAKDPYWWSYPLWWIFLTILNALFCCFIYYTVKTNFKKEFILSLFYHNGIFIPLTIITAIFSLNSDYVITLFLFTIFFTAFVFSTTPLFFKNSIVFKKKSNKIKNFNFKRIINPPLIITIIAVLLKLTNLNILIPNALSRAAQILGAITIPLIFIILGGSVYIDFEKRTKIVWSEIVKFTIIKNILFPLFVIFITKFIQPPKMIAFIMILLSAAPPITAIPVIVERYKGNRAIANQYFITSFMISVLTIPLMIWIYLEVNNLS